MYYRCHYTQTESGSCNNQNFGQQYCFYHRGVIEGRFKPSKQKYSLSTLPSHHDGGVDLEE